MKKEKPKHTWKRGEPSHEIQYDKMKQTMINATRSDSEQGQDRMQRLVRFNIEDLKTFAASRCLSIFNGIAEDELKLFPASIVEAWNIGADISELYNYNEAMEGHPANQPIE